MLATLPRPVDAETVSALLVAPVAVACGFPSPAQDYYDGPINLTSMLVEDQAATFIVRAAGHSMTGVGISRAGIRRTTCFEPITSGHWLAPLRHDSTRQLRSMSCRRR